MWPFLRLGGGPFVLCLGLGCVVPIGMALVNQFLHDGLISLQLLRLVVPAEWPADLGSFVPVQAEPAEAVQDRGQRLGHVTLKVSVVDAQDELAAVLTSEQPVKQGRADTANVEVTGWTRGE